MEYLYNFVFLRIVPVALSEKFYKIFNAFNSVKCHLLEFFFRLSPGIGLSDYRGPYYYKDEWP